MGRGRRRGAAVFVLLASLLGSDVSAQDLMLTEACEQGFRRLIRMAESGRLGEDVTNANVGVEKTRVRVELVRAGAPSVIVWLGPKTSAAALARFFDVRAGEGATHADLVRVGNALDQIFLVDPFAVAGYEAHPGGEAIPGFAEAWSDGGWRGVRRILERRMMAFASVEYTLVVLAVVAIGVVATLVLLWGAVPKRYRTGRSTKYGRSSESLRSG
jgi:hypothetical protein